MKALLAALDHPERWLPPVIHLAGTNGKGSTLSYLSNMYTQAGYRVHTYTSPHLLRYNERIRLAGEEVTDAVFAAALDRVLAHKPDYPVTEFEGLTAAAFLCFREVAADMLLLETGMGGRLDATNAVPEKIATVLTSISYDHQEFLGETLTHIAAEKAAIMRPGVPAISAPQHPEAAAVIRIQAEKTGAPLFWAQPETLTHPPGLRGAHQRINAAVAVKTVEVLRPQFPVREAAIKEGLAGAFWPARLQTLHNGALVNAWGTRGQVVLDGGHNAEAAEALAVWAAAQSHPVTLLLGLMARKDAAAFLRPLAPHIARLIAVPIADAPCHAPERLAETAAQLGISEVFSCNNWQEAAAYIARLPDAPAHLLVAGSLYLAGEVLKTHG